MLFCVCLFGEPNTTSAQFLPSTKNERGLGGIKMRAARCDCASQVRRVQTHTGKPSAARARGHRCPVGCAAFAHGDRAQKQVRSA